MPFGSPQHADQQIQHEPDPRQRIITAMRPQPCSCSWMRHGHSQAPSAPPVFADKVRPDDRQHDAHFHPATAGDELRQFQREKILPLLFVEDRQSQRRDDRTDLIPSTVLVRIGKKGEGAPPVQFRAEAKPQDKQWNQRHLGNDLRGDDEGVQRSLRAMASYAAPYQAPRR